MEIIKAKEFLHRTQIFQVLPGHFFVLLGITCQSAVWMNNWENDVKRKIIKLGFF